MSKQPMPVHLRIHCQERHSSRKQPVKIFMEITSCTIEGILRRHTDYAALFLLAGMESRTCTPLCQFDE